MKAIQKTGSGRGNIICAQVPQALPKAGEVKIDIAYAGICGTDMSIYAGIKETPLPVIMGHEFSGVISEVGAGVAGWKAGDRVVAETTRYSCGRCRYCKTGQHSLCSERKAFGQQTDGVFAETVCQDATFLHRIPDGVSLLEASMTEPAACAYHAVFDLNDVKPADTAVVIGPGPMGQFAAQMLKAAGAYVIVTGVTGDEGRLKLAKELGADETVLTDKENIKEVISKVTEGEGADYVFECAGFESALLTAFEIVKRMGTIVQVGIPGKGINLPLYNNVVLKEVKIQGAFSHRYKDWDKVLRMIDKGLLKVKPLASHFYTLEQCEEAFEAKDKIKVIFNINPGLDEN